MALFEHDTPPIFASVRGSCSTRTSSSSTDLHDGSPNLARPRVMIVSLFYALLIPDGGMLRKTLKSLKTVEFANHDGC